MQTPLPQTYRLSPAATDRACPLIFASPHSGRLVPQDMAPATDLDPSSLNSACDAAVDQLVSKAPSLGVPLIEGLVSRAYVDLNRAPTEIDPVLLVDAPQGLTSGPKTRAGYGVVPRLTGDGQPLYDRLLTLSEVEERLLSVHAPYHEALTGLMQQTKTDQGRAILIDWHSMPVRATGPKGADVVLGDRYGTACSVELTRLLRGLFEALGWQVGLNHPYAGGYATQIWGRPDEGFESLQIELSRKLYWDEARDQPSAGWGRCQSGLNRVIDQLISAYRR